MNAFSRKILSLILGVGSAFLLSSCGDSGSDGPIDFTNGALLEGSISGAPYRIAVPPQSSWNGTLVLYAHGYRDKARVNLEQDNKTAEAAPGGEALEQVLLAKGYAVAGSAYRDNGWVVELGLEDMASLTHYFRDTVAVPQRTVLMGFSMGSLIALKSIETNFEGLYDGAIAACSVGAGSTRNFDFSKGFLTAYDLVFGMPEAWGTPSDVNDNLDFENDVAPTVIQSLQRRENLPKWEFIRMVNNIPAQDFYSGNGFVLTDMFFATEARAELEARAGGAPVQDLTRVYSLLPEEKAALAKFGVPVDQLLAGMNARRAPAASETARGYLATYANLSGRPTGPVLAMHTKVDGFVLPGNQVAYQELASSQGFSGQFSGTYVDSVGHCAFSGEQIVRAIEGMNFWLARGAPPPAALFFPASAGFLENYTPRSLP
jgi:pimeloyl-ACP methyl ester carboxylesterase